jgi:hypothetical protein
VETLDEGRHEAKAEGREDSRGGRGLFSAEQNADGSIPISREKMRELDEKNEAATAIQVWLVGRVWQVRLGMTSAARHDKCGQVWQAWPGMASAARHDKCGQV